MSNDSKHASIHDIISQNKKELKKQQINQLFQIPQYPNLDLNNLLHSQMAITSPTFKFFVHQLEKWNKKIQEHTINTFSNTEFHKNLFVYNTLKKILMKSKNQMQRQLNQLHKWYMKNCQTYVNKSKDNYTSFMPKNKLFLQKRKSIDQQWQVRKTFKSNQPLELDNYKRRQLFPNFDKENNMLLVSQQMVKKTNNYMNNPNKEGEQKKNGKNVYPFKKYDQNSVFLQQNSKNKQTLIMKIKNDQLRKQRQQKQIQQARNSWNKTCSRFNQRSSQNFYKNFCDSNRTNYYNNSNNGDIENPVYNSINSMNRRIKKRNIKTAELNKTHHFTFQTNSIIDQIKKYRIQTSQSRRIKPSAFLNRFQRKIEKDNQENIINNKEQSKQINWIDRFTIDIQNTKLKQILTSENQNGKGLMSNPFDLSKKTKKKKK